MAAAYLEPRDISQGNNYEETLTIKDSAGVAIDFSSGYTALFQIRSGAADSGAAALISGTQANMVILGDGTISISIPASTTRTAITATNASVLYAELDVLETSSGEATSYRWELNVQREYARS